MKPAKLECADCKQPVGGCQFYTEINPQGGYGRPQMLVCDPCMKSGRWAEWIAKHWPNWPKLPRQAA